MIVHFVLPDKAAEEINGFLGAQSKRYRVTAPMFRRDIGEEKLEEITLEKIEAGHRNFGAVVVVPCKKNFCYAMQCRPDNPAIIEGIMPLEYARRVGKSRQRISQLIKKGAIKAERVGPLVVVVPS